MDARQVFEPWFKDYDRIESCRPNRLLRTFDLSNWIILGAFQNGVRLGGIILARGSSKFKVLRGHPERALVLDLRISPEARKLGIGTALWNEAEASAIDGGAKELWVETQNINVPACRFYQKMSCTLQSSDPKAYGPGLKETQLLWMKKLHGRGESKGVRCQVPEGGEGKVRCAGRQGD